MSCGARSLAGTAYCPACAGATTPISEICVKCGTKLVQPVPASGALSSRVGKSKVASILLAVFLGYWTWLYTYKKDAWKFWAGLGICLAMGIGAGFGVGVSIASNLNESDVLTESLIIQLMIAYIVITIIGTGIWIWGIVDTTVKKNEWYDNYPNIK
jgi:hypothetical protein